MNRFLLRALFMSVILTLGLPASASVITITSAIDLTTAQDNLDPDVSWVAAGNSSAPPVLVSAGDTVRLVYDFLPGQSIRMTGGYAMQSFWVMAWREGDPSNPEPGTAIFSDIGITLHGLRGNLAKPLFKASDTQPGWIIGAIDLQDHYVATGETISFTGLTAMFTVESLTEGPTYYDIPSVWFVVWDGYVTPDLTAVSEPTDIAIFLIGLVMVAAMVRHGRGIDRATPRARLN